MSPFLESDTSLNDLKGVKYVTVGGRIYFSDEKDSMRMGDEEHATLAEKAGANMYDKFRRPIVDDGGHIIISNGKIKFWDTTGSCKTNDPIKAKEITISVAKKILGEDKVV